MSPALSRNSRIVSIHAPTRGATPSGDPPRWMDPVSIHAPTRGATQEIPTRRDFSMFQSTRPRGARRSPECTQFQQHRFNPRAHAGRDIAALRQALEHLQFQSTRPRGARHSNVAFLAPATCVSIHAPTRGATTQQPPATVPTQVSIHAPTRGATEPLLPFLSRKRVSIHAPTRGATMLQEILSDRLRVSIHAPTRGATIRLIKYLGGFMFQSTRPRGARPAGPRLAAYPSSFNPRAHAGRDSLARRLVLIPSTFQSTRPRGARHDKP